jgi:hypothetical protein
MVTAAEGSGDRESSSWAFSRLPALASSDLSALHVEPELGSELVPVPGIHSTAAAGTEAGGGASSTSSFSLPDWPVDDDMEEDEDEVVDISTPPCTTRLPCYRPRR